MSLPILTKIKSENKFHYFVVPPRSGSNFMERRILLEKNFYDIDIWYQHELNPLPKLDIDKLHIEFYGRNPYKRLVSGFFLHWAKPTVEDLHEDKLDSYQSVIRRSDIIKLPKEKKILKFSRFVEILYALYKTYGGDRWHSKIARGHCRLQHTIGLAKPISTGNQLCENVGYIEPFNELVSNIRVEYRQIEDLENNFVLKENWKSTEHPDFGEFVRYMKTEYKDKEEYLNSFSKLGWENDTHMDYYNSDVLKMVNEIYEKDFELWNYEVIV